MPLTHLSHSMATTAKRSTQTPTEPSASSIPKPTNHILAQLAWRSTSPTAATRAANATRISTGSNTTHSIPQPVSRRSRIHSPMVLHLRQRLPRLVRLRAMQLLKNDPWVTCTKAGHISRWTCNVSTLVRCSRLARPCRAQDTDNTTPAGAFFGKPSQTFSKKRPSLPSPTHNCSLCQHVSPAPQHPLLYSDNRAKQARRSG